MKLGSKMILSYTVALFLIAGCCDYFLVRSVEDSFYSALQERLKQSLSLLYPSFADVYVSDANKKILEKRLLEFTADNNLSLSLYSPEGERVAASQDRKILPAPPPNTSVPIEVTEALKNGRSFLSHREASREEIRIFLAARLEHGALELGLSTAEIDLSVDRVQQIFWSAVLLWWIVSLLFTRSYLKRLEKVLSRWRRAAQRFDKGEVSGIFPLKTDDELEGMGRWMSQMSQGLDKKIAELTEERNQLKTILNNLQEGVLVLDAYGHIALMNPSVQNLLGIQDRALGHPPIDVIRNPDLQEIAEQSLVGQVSQKREIRLSRQNQETTLMVQASPLRVSTHRLGAILVVYDVTHLRRLERVRRDFVDNVSHELKTPLTAIQGYVETLLDGAIDDKEQAKNFLGIIDSNTQRLTRLVSDLLRLSEIEGLQFVLKPEECDLREILDEVVANHEVALKKKEIHVELKIASGTERLWVDPMALTQVLGNLLNNAIKYSNPKTEITIACAKQSGLARFSVADQGIGIAQADLSRIFERFYRVDKSRSRKEGGTGLGLSIVKHMVQLMGGEVQVESELGRGTVFSFTLPGALIPDQAH